MEKELIRISKIQNSIQAKYIAIWMDLSPHKISVDASIVCFKNELYL